MKSDPVSGFAEQLGVDIKNLQDCLETCLEDRNIEHVVSVPARRSVDSDDFDELFLIFMNKYRIHLFYIYSRSIQNYADYVEVIVLLESLIVGGNGVQEVRVKFHPRNQVERGEEKLNRLDFGFREAGGVLGAKDFLRSFNRIKAEAKRRA